MIEVLTESITDLSAAVAAFKNKATKASNLTARQAAGFVTELDKLAERLGKLAKKLPRKADE
jgi:hypothetical protein